MLTPATITYRGGTQKAAFDAYVAEHVCPALREGHIVLMANRAAHTGTRVREFIEARQCQVVYFPAYSPDFSPIELAFRTLKQFLRKMAARTSAALATAITAGRATITATDAGHWFAHYGFRQADQSLCNLL